MKREERGTVGRAVAHDVSEQLDTVCRSIFDFARRNLRRGDTSRASWWQRCLHGRGGPPEPGSARPQVPLYDAGELVGHDRLRGLGLLR